MNPITIVLLLVTAFAITCAETFTVLRTGKRGITIGGVPAMLVIGVLLALSGATIFTGERADIVNGVGYGCLAAYATIWGRAMGFVINADREGDLDEIKDRDR